MLEFSAKPTGMVNRIWRWHFGQGLVRSTDNFGRLGELPSHPALLDWLARRFIGSGWSIKAVHRLIVLSMGGPVLPVKNREYLFDHTSKGGIKHGATDDYGFYAVENKVHIHDLHATLLYLLGLDHERLTYRHAGRDFRLTDVSGNVVHQIIA